MPLLGDTSDAALWALPALVPLAWAAVTDLKRMEIEDKVHFALIGLFLAWAAAFLPFEEAGARVLQALVVLAVGLGLAVFAGMGGGDMKLAAAAAPFIPPELRAPAMVLLCAWLLALFAVMKGLRWGWRRAGRTPDWVSLNPEERQFPFGVALSGTAGMVLVALAL